MVFEPRALFYVGVGATGRAGGFVVGAYGFGRAFSAEGDGERVVRVKKMVVGHREGCGLWVCASGWGEVVLWAGPGIAEPTVFLSFALILV